jgi:GTP cyclohydrolase II
MSESLVEAAPRLATASIRVRVQAVLGRRTGAGHGASAEIVTFRGLLDGREHLACVWRPLTAVPLVRLHSECLTGDVLGSLRCDCGPQLDESIDLLSLTGGILLYMRQEGRGIGLYNKLDAYLLQDQGHDTFAANRMLGRGEDEREYAAAAQMLIAMDVRAAQLITNNPDKVEQLQRHGIALQSVRPTKVHINPHNQAYLRAKAEITQHCLDEASWNSADD